MGGGYKFSIKKLFFCYQNMVMAQKHTIEGGEVMKATLYPQIYNKVCTFSYINDPSCPRS